MSGTAEQPLTDEERQVARRIWPDDEDMDYLITSGQSADGAVWTWLRCSVHGGVMASVEWDLGMINVAAEAHYIRRHLRPNRSAIPSVPSGTGEKE